jgi:hypothetical protein
MAKSGLSLIAIAGPSRVLFTGVPRAYQGGNTLILILSILFVFNCYTKCYLVKPITVPVLHRMFTEATEIHCNKAGFHVCDPFF